MYKEMKRTFESHKLGDSSESEHQEEKGGSDVYGVRRTKYCWILDRRKPKQSR